MKISLKIENMECQLSLNDLNYLVGSISDIPINAPLFSKLALHPSATIRREIACKESIDGNTVRILSQDKDLGVLCNIVRCKIFQKNSSFGEVQRLIGLGSSELCENLASFLDHYKRTDLDKIVGLLMSNSDPNVRKTLAENWDIPKKFLKQLEKDAEPSVRLAACRD
jgi:hypothetical protein